MTTDENKSKRKRNKQIAVEEDYTDFRPFPLYIILVCGLIVTLVGLYLIITNNAATGVTLPNRSGEGGGQTRIVSGPGAIVVGLGICVFPAYQLLKKKFVKKD